MNERQLRRQCRHLLRNLDVQPPLDVADLCQRLGDVRGKPIVLVPYEIPEPGPFGAWITTPRAEYIVFQKNTSRSHQDHIILHELGHLLAGHPGAETNDALVNEFTTNSDPDGLRARYPDIPLDAVESASRRSHYDSVQEREAETVATIILEWASVLDATASQSSQGLARGMDTALGDRLGWL